MLLPLVLYYNGSPISVVSISSRSSSALSISDVFYVLQLSLSFPSISQLSDSGFDVVFYSSTCVMQDQVTRTQIGTSPLIRSPPFSFYGILG